ncbi:MAG: hypothetical protein A4E62_01317 [Syntrophorhabdus sp. PtaU1.Bin002]|nr:MAG: hypothetical protein A4E62_01317 [Syntrophorhabdus sp. PtaU1.Bin002]
MWRLRRSTIKPDERLSLSLLENANDFLDYAIKYTSESDKGNWKYALLHLASALELLLKALLQKEHWALLFDDVRNASKDKLEQGFFKSVDFVTAMNRLTSINGLDLSEHNKYLTKIQDIRNRIMHFAVDIHIEEVKSIAARGINTFIVLSRYRSNDPAREHELNKRLVEFQKFVDLRVACLKTELDAAERPSKYFSMCPLLSKNADS